MPDDLSPAGIGHNQPPEEFASLDPEILKARLARDYAELAARVIELEGGVDRAPPRVTNTEQANRLTTFVSEQMRPVVSELTKTHQSVKRAYLDCGRAVDDFFLTRAKRVMTAIDTIERRLQVWHAALREQQRKADAEARRRAAEQQRRAEEEQRRLEAEAARRAAENDRQGAARIAAQAEEAAGRADAAAQIVQAPSAPVRLHGEYGGTGFVRQRWRWEVIDPTQIPLGYLTLDEKAVSAAVEEGVREIPGLRIYPEEKFTVRRS